MIGRFVQPSWNERPIPLLHLQISFEVLMFCQLLQIYQSSNVVFYNYIINVGSNKAEVDLVIWFIKLYPKASLEAILQ
jgi:hypothetical protein